MEVLRLLMLALALAAVVLLPVLIALVVCADEVVDRLICRSAEWRQRRRERRLIARLNQAVEADQHDLAALDRADRRPLEQVAADLRCLRRERGGGGGPATVWHSSVLDAYDDRLRLACRALGITEHLAELAGVDRQIERVRVEGELDAAGLRLPATRPGQHEPRP